MMFVILLRFVGDTFRERLRNAVLKVTDIFIVQLKVEEWVKGWLPDLQHFFFALLDYYTPANNGWKEGNRELVQLC